MSNQNIPSEPPPAYADVTGGSSSTRPHNNGDNTGHLNVPGKSGRNGSIPSASRRSMEDETRPLPSGWVRTFDPESSHQFFVDTTKDPPRSIWTHPYDDDEYLSTLTGQERERIQQESMGRGHPPRTSSYSGELPPRPDKGKGKLSFGRKLKDKMTGMTHEQREQERAKRAEAERKLYEQHQRTREAMTRAMQTGQPQWIGKDKDGKDVYIEPPNYNGGPGGYGGGYGYSPYGSGIYSTPNARYIRPQNPYGRPYGYGYGGGYGMPLAMGLGGGLLGGMLIGDMAMGGMGMGGGM